MSLRERKKARRIKPLGAAVHFAARNHPFEPLESRQLLSTTTNPTLIDTPDTHGGEFNGYTPAQIRAAYGFSQLSLTGSGQTIAIVDAFDDPSIASDVQVFDAKYGLPAATINKIGQNGKPVRRLQADEGWASEIALDVEWAHAIAPDATIDLIETNTDDTDNLLAGVAAARALPGVSVISLSWGSSEYRGERTDDANFTTPTDHQGITVVAASGDEGDGPAEWPATSPDVVSVGGTTLTLNANGTYGSETTWSDTTGGVSGYEPLPSYQTGITGLTARTTPDVAYDADPNTGFAVYDSYGSGGWTVVAGTSAGVPQWAALVALADQQRVADGKGTLDGATGTLPALYGLYTGTTAGYDAAFNDITTGNNGSDSGGGGPGGPPGWGQRFDAGDSGAPCAAGDMINAPQAAVATPAATATADASHSSRHSSGISAETGYDEVTGLGTPKAASVVSALVNYIVPTSTSRRRHRAVAAIALRAHPSVVSDQHSSPIQQPTSAAIATIPAAYALSMAPTSEAFSKTLPENTDSTGTPFSWSGAAISFAAITTFPNYESLGGGSPEIASLPARSLATILNVVATPLTQLPGLSPNTVADLPSAAASEVFFFAPLDATSVFGDAMALFTHESTHPLIPSTAVSMLQPKLAQPRALTITLAVLAVDALLVGRWFYRRNVRNHREHATPFALARIAADADFDLEDET